MTRSPPVDPPAAKSSVSVVRVLVPDLPDAATLLPWLERIDRSRWYTNFGPLLREFETRLATFTGVADGGCVTTSSATAALELVLCGLGMVGGTRVLLPALTFPATALAVQRAGAVATVSDVDPHRWTLTPAMAREALRHRSFGLVMPVAAFGAPLPIAEWDDFVAQTGIPVVVDAAAALGAQPVGRRAHVVFSLHATKPLGIGEGGLLASADVALCDRVRRLSNFGFDRTLIRIAGGTNAKLSEYAAAVGLAQLERWPGVRARRAVLWRSYRRRLLDLPELTLQAGLKESPPAVLGVRLPDPLAAAEALAARGIETRRWYLPALHEHPALGGLAVAGVGATADLPVTRALARTLLGLPFHGHLSEPEVDRVVTALGEAMQARGDRGA